MLFIILNNQWLHDDFSWLLLKFLVIFISAANDVMWIIKWIHFVLAIQLIYHTSINITNLGTKKKKKKNKHISVIVYAPNCSSIICTANCTKQMIPLKLYPFQQWVILVALDEFNSIRCFFALILVCLWHDFRRKFLEFFFLWNWTRYLNKLIEHLFWLHLCMHIEYTLHKNKTHLFHNNNNNDKIALNKFRLKNPILHGQWSFM